MENRIMHMEISRLRTTDLLITKMDCTRRSALFKSLKLGLVGLLGIFVGQIAKTLYTAQVFGIIDFMSVPLSVYCVLGYLAFDSLEARSVAQKELINDILSIRLSRTGKKS